MLRYKLCLVQNTIDCPVRVALACQAALIHTQVNILEAYLDVLEHAIKINAGCGDGSVGPV